MSGNVRGRFHDLELLGQGGMASVYRARDTLRGSTVALKALRITAGTRHKEERIARFHSEYRTLAEIAHPRVIRVFDYGVDAEGPYYTMELLDGADLSARAPLPWRDVCGLLRDVCSSLSLLHSRGYVHRDVSPLNVRCTADGRAKLIDFGAMAVMGSSTLAMGTPPCVAPEALERQPLDGRTDLFALGATLYFTLTRRQAYAARTFTELRAAHQRAIRPPSAYAADVPPALDRLVLSLLSLDPMARPRHAAEVMERLTTIAELGPIEPVAVRRAYLNTPALIGRAHAVARISSLLADARHGSGRTLRIHAAHGGGRSRVLHATVMEARLMGMSVLQADAAEEASGPYGVLRALLRDMVESSERGADWLKRYPELASILNEQTPEPDTAQRDLVFRRLSELVDDICTERQLLIAVDEIEACDEPSLAALVTLAAGLRKKSMAIAYTDGPSENAEAPQALTFLRELSWSIELQPLELNEVEALLVSVFGSVPNIQVASSFIYERAFGNPRASIELAQALVDRGFARYELGSWTLPGQIDNHALPKSLLEIRGAKLADLSADAIELAQLLSLADGHPLSLEELRLLSGHESAERLEEARAELIEARIVTAGSVVVLADRSWPDVVRSELDAERSRELHRRMARLMEDRGDDPIRVARYWLRANDEAHALDVLCAALRRGSLVENADAEYPDMLQECLAARVRLQRSSVEEFLLSRELMTLSDRVVVRDRGDCFRVVLERLRRDSGLADYEALPDSPDRLALAITAAQARYDAAPESERVMAPIDAIRSLVEASYSTAVYAAMIADMQMLDRLPDLGPFEVFSPAIASVRDAVAAQRPLIGACYEEALERYLARFASLETAHDHLSPAQLGRARLLLRYALGSLQAGLGIKGALEHAEALDGLPGGQIMAAAVRESYYVRRGNTRAADEWRRRMELLQVQLKRPHALKLRQTTQQLECAAHADDLEETKRNLEVLQELCEVYPSALPYREYARAECERIRGQYTNALQQVRKCLSDTAPGRHPVWPWAAGCEVECLRLLGRTEEARAIGLQRSTQARGAGLRVLADHIEVFLALAEADLGDYDAATSRLDRSIQYREQFGTRGLNPGWAYEARAVVALRMRDRPTFETALQECASNYSGGRDNPALAARYERLLQEARAIWSADERLSLPSAIGPSSMMNSSSLMVSSQKPGPIVSGDDRDERAAAALDTLLSAAKCARGWLYLLRDEGLELAAGVHATFEHKSAAEALLASEDASDECSTTADERDQTNGTDVDTRSVIGSGFQPVLLTCPNGEKLATLGVLVIETSTKVPSALYSSMRAVCTALIELGDVKPKLR